MSVSISNLKEVWEASGLSRGEFIRRIQDELKGGFDISLESFMQIEKGGPISRERANALVEAIEEIFPNQTLIISDDYNDAINSGVPTQLLTKQANNAPENEQIESGTIMGPVKSLLTILERAIAFVSVTRWSYGVVGLSAAAAATYYLIPNPVVTVVGPVMVLIGMYALRLFPENKSWSVNLARHSLVLTTTGLIILLMAATVMFIIVLGLRFVGLDVPFIQPKI